MSRKKVGHVSLTAATFLRLKAEAQFRGVSIKQVVEEALQGLGEKQEEGN